MQRKQYGHALTSMTISCADGLSTDAPSAVDWAGLLQPKLRRKEITFRPPDTPESEQEAASDERKPWVYDISHCCERVVNIVSTADGDSKWLINPHRYKSQPTVGRLFSGVAACSIDIDKAARTVTDAKPFHKVHVEVIRLEDDFQGRSSSFGGADKLHQSIQRVQRLDQEGTGDKRVWCRPGRRLHQMRACFYL